MRTDIATCITSLHTKLIMCNMNRKKKTVYSNKKCTIKKPKKKKYHRGHPDLNWGPLDLQSNALPLSYIPNHNIN